MSSLIDAYLFLRCPGDYKHRSPIEIMLSVGTKYLLTAMKPRNNISDLVVVGLPSVMPRKCSRCKRRVLNDEFPMYARESPQHYVSINREFGCKGPGCESRVDLIPADSRQKWRRNRRETLENIKKTDWEEYFLRGPGDEIPDDGRPIEVQCVKCTAKWLDESPRWTTHTPPRYVPRERKCIACGRASRSKPVDKAVLTIATAALSKLWTKFLGNGVDLRDYPRCPEIYWSNAYHVTKKEQLEEAEEKRKAGQHF
ncbi:hypothetical protein BJX96DRAFT_152382 [Aspergillus floccosus]